MRRWQRSAVFVALSTAVFAVFQNCGQAPLFDVQSFDLPSSHPSVEASMSSTDMPLMDRQQLTAFLQAAFAAENDDYTRLYVKNLVDPELRPAQQAVGGLCEIAESGGLEDCNYDTNHLTNRMTPSTSSVREAVRVQACLALVDNVQIMYGIRTLSGGAVGVAPVRATVEGLAARFYPEGVSAALVDDLMKLDQQMQAQSESVDDRWRLLIQTLCESPGWQFL